MPSNSNIYNAMGWAHLQLRGGWQNLFITTGAYTVLVAVLMLATVQLNPRISGSIYTGWTNAIIILQTGVLLFFGCITTTAAVRTDHSSRMIESHRIMPTSLPMAILGYIIGAPAQAIGMAIANFLIGSIAPSGAQSSFSRWAIANLILFTFAIFVCVLVVFFGYMAQTAFRWIVTAVIVGFSISQGNVLMLLPGTTVLATPLIGNSIFSMRTTTASLSWEYMVCGAAQLAVGAICFTAAARKYRRADTPAFGSDLGLLFLATWVIISMIGIHYWQHLEPIWLRGDFTG